MDNNMVNNMNTNTNIPETVPNANRPEPIAVPGTAAPAPQAIPQAAAPVPQAIPQAAKPIPEAVTKTSAEAYAPVAISSSTSVATAAPEAVASSTPVATPVEKTMTETTPVPAVSATSVSSATEATTTSEAVPAINPAAINPMPEVVPPAPTPAPATPAQAAKINSSKTPVEEEIAENKKAVNKERRGGVAQTVLISAAVGLLFGIIGTVAVIFIQNKTTLLDKFLTADAVETVEPTEADPVDPDLTIVTTDPNQVIDTSANIPNNSFSTAYTTVITGESDVITVTENAMPSMVTIIKEYNYIDSSLSQYFGYGQNQEYVVEASGSGFIIAETDTEFLIVSNNHVVENPISLEITFVDGSSVAGYIKGCDKSRDIAVVAVLKSDISDETLEQIRIASLGDSNNLRLGEQVVAIGNALGYGQSVTTGIISALNREMETEEGYTNKFIQTDAAINPGNSGGALLNMAGQVIGINSNKLAETSVEGMGYAIPISDVTDIIEELMEHSTKIPLPDDEVGYIGISLQEVTESLASRFGMPVGIYIVETVDGGAAEAAGLQAGDVITEFAGEKVESYDDLDRILQCYAAGETVTIKYQRSEDGTYVEHTTELTLGTKP